MCGREGALGEGFQVNSSQALDGAFQLQCGVYDRKCGVCARDSSTIGPYFILLEFGLKSSKKVLKVETAIPGAMFACYVVVNILRPLFYRTPPSHKLTPFRIKPLVPRGILYSKS